MKITYSPEEVLKICIMYYAKTDCTDFNASASAKFVETKNGPVVELTIKPEQPRTLTEEEVAANKSSN